MPPFLQFSPGLVFWTLINFSIFVFIIAKFAWKPMRNGLQAREQAIADSIASAEAANREAKELMMESREKISKAHQDVMDVMREGRAQAETVLRRASEEAEAIKKQKLTEAQREIDRQRDDALQVLRTEVAALVVEATEKLIGKKLDGDDHKKIIEASVSDLSRN